MSGHNVTVTAVFLFHLKRAWSVVKLLMFLMWAWFESLFILHALHASRWCLCRDRLD